VAEAGFQPNVLFQTYVAANLLGAVLERAFAARGLSRDDFGLSSAIGVWGPITPTELSARVGMPSTTLSSALARLDRRGYVRRAPNPKDGRSYLIELTEEGDLAWRGGWPALREAIESLERELGGSLDEVQDAVARLQDAACAALAVDEAAISQ
jgi:DNA-binding MarR family transcriptional regulator